MRTPAKPTARRIEIHGVVQGVGFRPYVFQLAQQYCLSGQVANTASGVLIHIEGDAAAIAGFIEDLSRRKPPLAHILEVTVTACEPDGRHVFEIVSSRADSVRTTLISPDVAVCADCLAELLDPADRRHRYPFINCTNCGPRYTIIQDIPYDRPATVMHRFQMCSLCQHEYDDPNDRRFHAQPNACPVCGPQVALCNGKGERISADDPIEAAGELLKAGRILAVKGIGGFHLAVDATNPAAVEKLRRRKHREEKPLALMVADLDAARHLARVSAEESLLLTSIQRPIVLLEKKESTGIAAAVSPHNRYFGIMLPYAPLHHLLMHIGFTALVMTSGNRSQEPLCIDNAEAYTRLEGICDAFLVHDRDIFRPNDDSIVHWRAGGTGFIRRSRGYVPLPILMKKSLPPVLAVGAELKNTVCILRGREAFLSQHVGDLENYETLAHFEKTIEQLSKILDVRPRRIAHDLHPDYMSTHWAQSQSHLPCVAVQHHHAHIAACLAENQATGPTIGLAFDGTGYGSDGAIWGGEVLLVEGARFTRMAHMQYVPMPGGAAAIRAPWRMAIGYLQAVFGDRPPEIPSLQNIDEQKRQVVAQMAARLLNSPLTSSLGRLFDAVAALTGLHQRVRYEGQAAMALEMASTPTADQTYPFAWRDGTVREILIEPLIRAVVCDCLEGLPPAVIGARFHATLVQLFTRLCKKIRKDTGVCQVALSGGVFQNRILLTELKRALVQAGFAVYNHQLVPANDGGLSLGQAMVAAWAEAGDREHTLV